MVELEQTRRAVAAAYVRAHGDKFEIAEFEALARVNIALRAEIQARLSLGHTRTARYVFGRIVAAVIVAAVLAMSFPRMVRIATNIVAFQDEVAEARAREEQLKR